MLLNGILKDSYDSLKGSKKYNFKYL